jgi:hypothetical protein
LVGGDAELARLERLLGGISSDGLVSGQASVVQVADVKRSEQGLPISANPLGCHPALDLVEEVVASTLSRGCSS